MKQPCFAIVLLLFLYHGFAQTDSASLRFHFLGVKDGLPEGSVNTLLQDKYGYIWVGTQNGLVRYDGYQPKVYKLSLWNSTNGWIGNLFEDREGRLWVGTPGGILFYYNRDHDAFISYILSTTEQNNNEDYRISYLSEDNKGYLWFIVIRSRSGEEDNPVISFNPRTHVFTSYGSYEKNIHRSFTDDIHSLIKTGNGVVLAGGKKGLYRYDTLNDRFVKCVANPDSLSRKYVNVLAADKVDKDAVWLTSKDEKGGTGAYDNLILYHVKTGALQAYHHVPGDKNSFPGTSIYTVYCAQNGKVWIGSEAGLTLFDKTSNHFLDYMPPDAIKTRNASYANIFSIIPDSAGNLWCGDSWNGLLLYHVKDGRFERYTYNPKNINGIVSNDVQKFIIDNTGTIWFGVSHLGLQWTNTVSSKFTRYQGNTGLPHYFPGGGINGVAESPDGVKWLSTDKGLYRWQPGTDSFSRVRLGKYISSGAVITDHEGSVWSVIYRENGVSLVCYNPKTKQVINYRHKDGDSTSLPYSGIESLIQDHTGAIWIGTFGEGIIRLDKKTGRFTKYPYIANAGLTINSEAIKQKVLDDNKIWSIYEDESGTLWVGTNSGSLNRYDRNSDRFTPYQKPIPDMYTVLSLISNAKGKLWSGTYVSGLYQIDPKQNTYTKLSEKDGLLYNGCYGLQYDNTNHLWVSSPRGFSIISGDKVINNLTVASGLPAEPSSLFLSKTSEGNFIYGTNDGFVVFNPDNIINNPLPPPVIHIESIAFANEKKGQTNDSVIQAFGKQEIHLAYDENRLTISYVGLVYQNASLTKYQYQLKGYDKNWIDGGTLRQVTYTNLSPGSYTFRVKAINSDGVESRTTESINIIISPPWWKTWWAYVLYVLLLGAAVWAFVVYRSRQLLAQNKLLELRVNKRTEQLHESLTELKSTQAQLIQSEKMASLGELTAGIAHEIQNPLNFVNNFSEVNNELIEEMTAETDMEEVKAIANDIKQNNEKIAFHGKRADAIVKGMLQHSRQSKGTKEPTDINALCDEYIRLSYHGLRAKDKSFNSDFTTEYDESIGSINIVPQDMGRVLLNLFNNAFYAVNERSHQLSANNYQPLVSVQTKRVHNGVEIIITDNGSGIAAGVINKIFQPFFTTKPTGEGTGLGLSLSYDIVTKEHGGTLHVQSKEGEGTTFIISLPVNQNQ